jgi:hypothetical protein
MTLDEKAAIVEIKSMVLKVTRNLFYDDIFNKDDAVRILKIVIRNLDLMEGCSCHWLDEEKC